MIGAPNGHDHAGLIRGAESGHRTGRMSGRNPIEVLVRADQRRSWTVEQKREIVIESLDPHRGTPSIAEVCLC